MLIFSSFRYILRTNAISKLTFGFGGIYELYQKKIY